MEGKNLNFNKNENGAKFTKNSILKHNKSYNGMKYIRNRPLEISKTAETEGTSNKNKSINAKTNLADLIKENESLQNQSKQDKKTINLLRQTINKLLGEQDRNIISNKLYDNGNTNILNKKIYQNNNLTYADIIINAENILEENTRLNKEIKELKKIKNENLELKNKYIDFEQTLNELIINNSDLEKKLEIKEKKILYLYHKLKDFQTFEEIKILNDSLNRKLQSKIEEVSELNKLIKEKEKEINDLKYMKYDNKLFILEQELTEYKLEQTKYSNEIIKLKSDLKNTKNKLEINTNLLNQSQTELKENRLNIEIYMNEYNNIKNEYNSLKNKNNKLNEDNQKLAQLNLKIKNELNEIKISYTKNKEELNNISNELNLVKNEKEKNEVYYLDKIKMIQKEKNYIEKNLNEIKDKFLFTKNFENALNTNDNNNNTNDDIKVECNELNKYNDKYLRKKYEIAINEINSYNKDNKKLVDLSKKLKNDLSIITEEKNFYINIINKLIEGKYIDSKYNNFVNLIKKSIENYLDIQNTNKIKYDLEQELIKYEKVLENLNKKINSEDIGKSYDINKNFYDVDDFSEIAKIQNQIISAKDKLNILYDNKNNIQKEIQKF